ncbi:MAG: hypothetical protein HY079_00270 [Elusimicrobia bacterium]|nr:hypothetical protein [Elusimicrobiota bacterium]
MAAPLVGVARGLRRGHGVHGGEKFGRQEALQLVGPRQLFFQRGGGDPAGGLLLKAAQLDEQAAADLVRVLGLLGGFQEGLHRGARLRGQLGARLQARGELVGRDQLEQAGFHARVGPVARAQFHAGQAREREQALAAQALVQIADVVVHPVGGIGERRIVELAGLHQRGRARRTAQVERALQGHQLRRVAAQVAGVEAVVDAVERGRGGPAPVGRLARAVVLLVDLRRPCSGWRRRGAGR